MKPVQDSEGALSLDPEGSRDENPEGQGSEEEDVIICRCEEVTRGEIVAAIRAGARTPAGIRARTRAGMGLCQGSTCMPLIAQILAEETGIPLEKIEIPPTRPPARPVKMKELAR
jgi:NAD(P)H-nitrite reductase large subunit